MITAVQMALFTPDPEHYTSFNSLQDTVSCATYCESAFVSTASLKQLHPGKQVKLKAPSITKKKSNNPKPNTS